MEKSKISNDSLRLSKLSLLSCQNVPTWYHNLSTDTLLNVFQYFDESELLKTIMLVCRRWRYIGQKPVLWKTLHISGRDVPLHFICHRIRDLPLLQCIILNNISEPVAAIRQICRCIPNLRQLSVRNCPTIPESALRNLIQCCKHLETLDLSGTKFKAHRFYEEIAGLVYLKSVNLSKNSCLSVKNLMSVVLNCRKLQELRLSIFSPLNPLQQLSDEDASFIISNLAPDLRSLTLDTSTLTNFSFKAIMQCKKLERLGLYGAGNLSSDVFIEMWKYLPNLKVIKIRNAHQITGQNIHDLFISGKQIMKQITSIDFSGCWKITDIGVEAIAHCCENLETLSLKSCKRIINLKPIRDHCKLLKKLNVAFCTNLDPLTIIPLQEKINTLVVDNSNKYVNLIENIQQENPDLSIKICLSEYNKEMEKFLPPNT